MEGNGKIVPHQPAVLQFPSLNVHLRTQSSKVLHCILLCRTCYAAASGILL